MEDLNVLLVRAQRPGRVGIRDEHRRLEDPPAAFPVWVFVVSLETSSAFDTINLDIAMLDKAFAA